MVREVVKILIMSKRLSINYFDEMQKQEEFVSKCSELGLISSNRGFTQCITEIRYKILDSRNCPLPSDYIMKLKSITPFPVQLNRFLIFYGV